MDNRPKIKFCICTFHTSILFVYIIYTLLSVLSKKVQIGWVGLALQVFLGFREFFVNYKSL